MPTEPPKHQNLLAVRPKSDTLEKKTDRRSKLTRTNTDERGKRRERYREEEAQKLRTWGHKKRMTEGERDKGPKPIPVAGRKPQNRSL